MVVARCESNEDCTPGCPECNRGHQVLVQKLSGDLLFADAFELWLSHRVIESNGHRAQASYISRNSEKDYSACARALAKFPPFRVLPLKLISPVEVMRFEQARSLNAPDLLGKWRGFVKGRACLNFSSRRDAESWQAAAPMGELREIRQTIWERTANPNRVRKESNVLLRILRDARLWGEEQDRELLRVVSQKLKVRRAMSPEEQHRFLHVAAAREAFRFIYQYAIVALQTTASTDELRALRIGNILLEDRVITIPEGKNKYRVRSVPIITDDCAWALEGMLARARRLGATSPAHYLFPFRVSRKEWDASRPMSESGLKKQWDAVRKAAQMPALRIYDLRHTGITRMAEAGVPLPVAMSFAGHMTQAMQQHYTSISMASQRGWGAAVWGDRRDRVAATAGQAWPERKPLRAEMVMPARGLRGA